MWSFARSSSGRLAASWLRLGALLGLILSMGVGLHAHQVVATTTPSTITWPNPKLVLRASGFTAPTSIVAPPDGTNRLFVTQRNGIIRIIENGVLLTQPFLDLQPFETCSFGETGLLGLAFPPDYAQKGFFYVYHNNPDCHVFLARYKVTANPNVADPTSREELLQISKTTTFHNGGQILFGPDGYLYIGVGDDEFNGGPNNWSQDTNRLVGKILRIGVQSQTGTWYTIPPTNPYAQGGGSPLVWATGLRNPFRFSFDSVTHDLWVGDVGDLVKEEVNMRPASALATHGGNYGWADWEADICRRETCSPLPNQVNPIYTYAHHDGCTAGIGGTVYRGAKFPRLQGIYFYSEFCWGWLGGVKFDGNSWQQQWFLHAPFSISTMGQDQAGNLYVGDFNNGGIYEIVEHVTYVPFATK